MGDPEEQIFTSVYAALAEVLAITPEQVAAAADRDLEELGLDSHGLMRVTLALEERFGLSEWEVPDEALDSPRALARALEQHLKQG